MAKPRLQEEPIDEIPAEESPIDELPAEATDQPIDEIPAENTQAPEDGPGFFEKIFQGFKQRQAADAMASQEQAAVDEEAKAKAEADDQNPENWTAERFRAEAPKPRNMHEQAVHDAFLKDKESKQKGLAQKAYKALFETPAAANREAIRAAGKGQDPKKGYEAGATDPEASESFQSEAIRHANDAVTKFQEKTGIKLENEDADTAVRFVAGLPGSTLGMLADTVTNPADLLLTILGEKALKYVGKASVAGRTMGERAAGDIRDILKGRAAMTPKTPPVAIPATSPELKPDIKIPGPDERKANFHKLVDEKDFIDDQSIVETEFIKKNLGEFDKAYNAKIKDEYGVDNPNIISSDVARTAEMEGRGEFTNKGSAQRHAGSSAYSKLRYEETLAKEPEKPVLVSAGISGAGKTGAIRRFNPEALESAIIYDTNVASTKSGQRIIDQALESNPNRQVVMFYVDRDPIAAFEQGVIPRYLHGKEHRVLPIKAHVNNARSKDAIIELSEIYKDNPRVTFKFVGNYGKKGEYTPLTVDELKSKVYNLDEIGVTLEKSVERRLNAGQITKDAAEAFLGKPVVQGAGRATDARPLRSGLQGKVSGQSSGLETPPPSNTATAIAEGPDDGAHFAGNINLDRLQTTDEATKVIRETSELFKTKINEQTRGKVTHEETEKLAKDLGMSKDKLLKQRKGKALNAEEVLAARDILKSETGKVVDLHKKIMSGQNDDATLDEFRRQIVAQANVQKAVSGSTAEAGRALSAHKVVANAERAELTAAKLKVRASLEKESIESLIEKATRRLRNVKGAVGKLGEADPEIMEAQAELMRRAAKAGAKSTGQVTQFLVKAGLSDDVARLVVTSAQDVAGRGTEFVQKKMTEALGDREVTQEIARRMSKVDLQDPVAVNRFIREVSKAKTSDQVYFYFINSILSNPKTHIVNSASNMARSLANPLFRAAGAALEAPKRIYGGTPEVYFGEAGSEIVGKLQGMKEGARRFLFTMRNGITEEQVTKFDARPVPIKGKAGDILGQPTRALAAEDEFFKAVNSQGELHAQAYRTAIREKKKGGAFWSRVHELIDSPTPQMAVEAEKAATRQTFQDELGPAGKSYMSFRNKFPGLRWITPFVKTPVNILKEAVRMTPGTAAMPSTWAAKGADKAMVKGQAAVGTAASYYFAQRALEGRLTGAAPKKEAERKKFYAEGKRPYAIKVGNRWVEYRRMEPFATPIGLIADSYRLWREKDLADAKIGEIAAEAGNLFAKNAVEKTFMQGLNNLVNAMEDPERYGERFISSFASAAVPFSGAVRAAANASDDTVRDPQTLIENVKTGIPGLSQTVQPKLDPYGEPAKKSGGILERTLSPMESSKESDDPVTKELSRLNVAVPPTGRSQEGVKLTDKEYFEFTQRKGRKVREGLERLINASNYQKQDDHIRKSRLEKYLRSKKTEPKDVEKRAGARVYDEISSKLAGMESSERPEYIMRLLERKKVSAKIARRLRRDFTEKEAA